MKRRIDAVQVVVADDRALEAGAPAAIVRVCGGAETKAEREQIPRVMSDDSRSKDDPTDQKRAEGPLDPRIEALHREIERLTVLASRERGLIESILDASPYGIIVSDPHGKLILQSKAAERIWAGSASASDIAGWGQYRGFHPDGRPYEGGDWAMARCLLDGVTVEPEEMRIQRFDGSHGVLLGGSAPIRDGQGTLLGAVAIFADVTALKEAQQALLDTSERFQTTLRSIGDAVIATDARGRINFLNPIAEQLTQRLGNAELLWSRVSREPYATIALRPGVERPRVETSRPNVVRAGAWTDTGWPATMESAVRSGRRAAQHILSRFSAKVRT